MVIEKLEPFFLRIIRRQHLTLSEFCAHGVQQIVQGHAALLSPTCLNDAIDSLLLSPLNNRCQNLTADQSASIENLILSISESDRQKPILIDVRKDRRKRMLGKIGT